jgi:hypothetical protein
VHDCPAVDIVHQVFLKLGSPGLFCCEAIRNCAGSRYGTAWFSCRGVLGCSIVDDALLINF